jgi:hypothetical protein
VSEAPLDPIAIDVGRLVQRTVASLYSHLVTRQTGRAVRLAIEGQLAEVGDRSLSLIDLSEVAILDFSCADEVVAKLLLRYQDADQPVEAFFVFNGVSEPHRDQVEVVLLRQSLAAVAETGDGSYELLGAHTDAEAFAWTVLEARGFISTDEIADLLQAEGQRQALDQLVQRRLAFQSPINGRYHALSRLVSRLM